MGVLELSSMSAYPRVAGGADLWLVRAILISPSRNATL
jgi:hypothetical protein